MIHHISIPARDPVRVAAVLAELMNGRDFPFSGPLPGAHMAMSGDPQGTMIEVYPDTITLAPGEDEAQVAFTPGPPTTGYFPFHALISVPLDRAAIERIGAREGWRTKFFGRGAPGKPPVFHLLEFWVENRVMLELAPSDLVHEYASFMQISRIEALMRERADAAAK
ncbi:hypothetical protein [Methylocystis hirsuta]|uniref:VOC family protein n=1 Tax=Methylocystis hirsuta TaxID=369798 RepID=A0A3M9XMN1_9HYPH|nr:hypothetical protein [Methylocystis hirsuta]RNJ49539.1 hypothetical protein D1O30_07915 [Methylocystis hirsuta]